MKTLRFTFLMLAASFLTGLGTGIVDAQSCEAYFPMKKGAAFQLSHYNGKDKLETTTSTTILEESNDGDVFTVFAQAATLDAKGKEVSSVKYDVTCVGDAFHMDMSSFSFGQSQQMQGMEGVDFKVDSEDMIFPKGLAVGAALPDASMTMTATMNGMTIMNTTVKVINRKVTGKESLTTAAGTFSCLVVEEDVESHMMGMNMSSHTKSWYSLGVGMVRTESTRNGKLESYSILTKISGN